MAKGLQETLLALLADPAAVAAQADLVQAVTLARQELSFRQRAGAAAFRLRQAKAEGAEAADIADLTARLDRRRARLEAARVQAAAADLKRPFPEAGQAQIFGRATGAVDAPPLTAAARTATGEVAARAGVGANGSFLLAAPGDLNGVVVQVSDAGGRVLWRSAPLDVAAGTVRYLDAAVGEPEAAPGPVPAAAQMPDLVGQGEDVARTLLARLGIPDPAIVDQVAKGSPGIVIAQTPRAGLPLKPGAKVSLTLRRAADDGPEPAFLPGLVGRPVAEAQAALKRLGLRAAIRLRPDDGALGMVLDQSPPEGSPLGDLKSVDLAVSQARAAPPETALVPDLRGRPRDLALELLKATDLRAEVTETAEASAAAGVTGQDPKAGTPVARGSVVRITLNTPPKPEPGRVMVPQLVGRDVAEAKTLLSALGLKTAVRPEPGAEPEGRVLRQDPGADAKVDAGSTVTLSVATGKPAKGATPDARPGKTAADDAGTGPAKTGAGPVAEKSPEADPATKAADRKALIRAIAETPRASAAGWTAARLETLLDTAGATTAETLRALADLPARDIGARLGLTVATEATAFRAALLAALKARG